MRHALTLLLTGLTISLSVFVNTAVSKQNVPSEIGGFTLYSPISNYDFKQYQNYLSEVIIADVKGFRKGFITYGTCENPGKILRIKLKYHDRSATFFDELLKRYKQSFGPKPEFTGDRFGNVKSWKWSFINADKHMVTLVLQHNLKDAEESIGNMVKLTLPDLIDAERLCFNKTLERDTKAGSEMSQDDHDWEMFIPR